MARTKFALYTTLLAAAVFGSSGPLHSQNATASHFTNWLEIRAPYAGYWDRFGFTRPQTHHTPWNGNWATDYYAAPGANGAFRIVNSNGGTAYGTVASRGSSCAGSTWAGFAYTFSIYDGSGYRGWYVTAHVADTAPGGWSYLLQPGQAVYNGTHIGQTAFWGKSSCYEVDTFECVHWHIEMQQPTHYSCWFPWSAGSYLQITNGLGAVGSNALSKTSCW